MARGPFLDDALRHFHRLHGQCGKCLERTGDEDFFRALDAESNSIAILVKHLAGNLRSRFTDFLSSDGEKPDRNRDLEFRIEPGDTRELLERRLEAGFESLFEALEPLAEPDLQRSVRIRGEELSVLQALSRQVAHYAYHTGQIVLLARHFAGPRWESLSIPRDQSAAHLRAQGPSRYLAPTGGAS